MHSRLSVITSWLSAKAAKSANLISDGKSIWSYGNYEIARRIGPDAFIVRSRDEFKSKTTSAQITKILRIVGNFHIRPTALNYRYILPACGRVDKPAILGSPDWYWLDWCNYISGGWVSKTVRVDPTAKFRGHPVLAKLRESQDVFRIHKAYVDKPGLVHMQATARRRTIHKYTPNGVEIVAPIYNFVSHDIQFDIELDKLIAVDPPVPEHRKLVINADNKTEPDWRWKVFGDIDTITPVRNMIELYPNEDI